MVFENDDEFGVQDFREGVKHVFDANSITVKLIKHNSQKDETLQGDFLGIKRKTFSDEKNFIKINLMSEKPKGETQKQEGFDGRGDITYHCYTDYNVDITNKDLVEFVTDYGHDIKSGQRFSIKLEDMGLYKGQFTFIEFTMSKI